MKLFFIILFCTAFYSCTPEDSGKIDSSPIVLSDADRIKNLETKVSSLIKDTVYKAKQIAALKKNDSIYNIKVNSEAAKLSAYLTRFTRDSVYRDRDMKAFIAKRRADSLKIWLAIQKLQGASPVTAIPKMQSDIKSLQSKNVSQDKNIISNIGSINNLNDTLNVLKKVASSDFDFDSTGKFRISQSFIKRMKAELQQ